MSIFYNHNKINILFKAENKGIIGNVTHAVTEGAKKVFNKNDDKAVLIKTINDDIEHIYKVNGAIRSGYNPDNLLSENKKNNLRKYIDNIAEIEKNLKSKKSTNELISINRSVLKIQSKIGAMLHDILEKDIEITKKSYDTYEKNGQGSKEIKNKLNAWEAELSAINKNATYGISTNTRLMTIKKELDSVAKQIDMANKQSHTSKPPVVHNEKPQTQVSQQEPKQHVRPAPQPPIQRTTQENQSHRIIRPLPLTPPQQKLMNILYRDNTNQILQTFSVNIDRIENMNDRETANNALVDINLQRNYLEKLIKENRYLNATEIEQEIQNNYLEPLQTWNNWVNTKIPYKEQNTQPTQPSITAKPQIPPKPKNLSTRQSQTPKLFELSGPINEQKGQLLFRANEIPGIMEKYKKAAENIKKLENDNNLNFSRPANLQMQEIESIPKTTEIEQMINSVDNDKDLNEFKNIINNFIKDIDRMEKLIKENSPGETIKHENSTIFSSKSHSTQNSQSNT